MRPPSASACLAVAHRVNMSYRLKFAKGTNLRQRLDALGQEEEAPQSWMCIAAAPSVTGAPGLSCQSTPLLRAHKRTKLQPCTVCQAASKVKPLVISEDRLTKAAVNFRQGTSVCRDLVPAWDLASKVRLELK